MRAPSATLEELRPPWLADAWRRLAAIEQRLAADPAGCEAQWSGSAEEIRKARAQLVEIERAFHHWRATCGPHDAAWGHEAATSK